MKYIGLIGVSPLHIHTHCQVAQKAITRAKLVKEYGCPNARQTAEKKARKPNNKYRSFGANAKLKIGTIIK